MRGEVVVEMRNDMQDEDDEAEVITTVEQHYPLLSQQDSQKTLTVFDLGDQVDVSEHCERTDQQHVAAEGIVYTQAQTHTSMCCN